MFAKIWAICWNHIYRTYIDRTALLFMFLLPISLSLIFGLAFGTQDGDIDIEESTLIVINHDTGGITADGRKVNWGNELFVNFLIENTPQDLQALIQGEISTDEANARNKVEDGDARAVLIIPAAFTENVLSADKIGEVELYYNPGSQVGSTVVIAIVERLVAFINTGQVAEQVLFGVPDGYITNLALAENQIDAIPQIAQTELPILYQASPESIVQLHTVNVEGDIEEFDALKFFAPSLAIFFMTFTMAGGTRAVLEEHRDRLLHRILTTPTPRWVYMVGKLLGTYLSGVLQMLILLVVTPIMAAILGNDPNVWGNNYIGLALITLSVVAAATGLGLLISALGKNVMDAANYSSAILLIMAVVGGTFFPLDDAPSFIKTLSNISLNKWGVDGFNDLSLYDASVGDILPNVLALLVMTVAFFMFSLWRFNQRLDV